MGTRDTLLDAAAQTIRNLGLARATTKEIARASGFSEATLYKYFADKTELFLAVLKERVSSFGPLAEALACKPGGGDLAENLAAVVRAAAHFYTESFAMNASIFAEPTLLAAHRTNMARGGAGPHMALETLAKYVSGERERGRIRSSADPRAVAAMLLGASLQYGFLTSFAGRAADPDEIAGLASAAVAAVLSGIAP